MKRYFLIAVCLALGGLGTYVGQTVLQGQPAAPASRPAATGLPAELVSYRDIVKKVLPAVVSIESQAKNANLRRRFDTDDDSVNRPLLALITLGGGWHNNHHRYGATARAGFAWYEIDVTYYILKLLQWVGFVKEMRDRIPDDVRREGGLN